MKTKTKNIFKSALSLTLALIMVLGVAPISGFVPIVNAESTDTKSVDFDILSAQYISGYRSIPNATGSSANDIFEYYVADDVHSPSRDFLNACYEDEALMTEIAMWDLYTSGASFSSAFGQVLDQDDYCELLLLQAIDMTLKEGNLQKILKNDALNDSKKIASALCKSCKVATVADLIESVDVKLDNVYATEKLTEVVSKYYGVGTTSKVCQGIGDIVDYSKDIVEAYEKIVMYNTMVNLDQYTKEWLLQMYNNCDGTKKIPMKTALKNLIAASDGTSGAILASVQNTTETLANWAISEAIDASVKVLASGNVIVAAIFAGLSAGKLVSNLLFATDDIFEQLYTMEQLVQLEELAKKCAKDAKQTFLSKQDKENALYFDRSTELYFIIITDVDIDCMKKLVNTLWSGGFGSQAILKLLCGATSDDYNELIEIYDSLKETRKENYQYMKAYCNVGLKVEYPEVFDALFTGSDSNIDESIYNNYYFGKCGSNVSWRLDKSTGLLEVSGLGNIYDNPNWGGTESLIKSVKIENGVTSIGKSAFYSCDSLTSVTIGNSVTSIGDGAFEYCTSLTSVTIPDGVTSIGNFAFNDCTSLTSVTIGNSVTTIDDYAFLDCTSLTSVTIPGSVTSIGDYVFADCTSLTSVTIPDSVTSIGIFAFNDCTSLTSVTIGNSVTSIGMGAFAVCSSLESVTIPNNVTIIGEDAFWGCTSLTSVKIPDSVTSIGDGAFFFCPSLTSVTIGNSVTSIGDGAFRDCYGLTSVTIGNSVTSIGNYAFYGCDSLTSVTIPNSVTSIGCYAFDRCSLTSIMVDAKNECYSSIDGVLFNKNKTELIQYPTCNARTSYAIPNSVISIGNDAFCSCDYLTSVTIPNSVTIIGDGAFGECISLTRVVIPDSVTSIGDGAFEYCKSLTSVTIPDSVTSIGVSAFCDCTSLTDVYYTGSEENWNKITIGDGNDPLLNATIHYDWIDPCVQHTLKTVIVAPTCTEDGEEYQICEVCGEKIGESKVLPALGHDFGEWTVKTAATCKSEGEEIHTCMRDGCNYSETRKIEKLSTHELKTIRVEPTCTEDGEEYHLCELCEERIGETVVLPATGHSWSEWTVKIPATFEAEGTSERTCSICQEKETEIIPKLEPIPVDAVELSEQEQTLKIGETLALTATVKPTDATDKTVVWTSSDESVASVDENGNVTAVSVGTATITATASNGMTAECQITVEEESGGVLEVIKNILFTPVNLIVGLLKLIIGLFK